jgi:hypothetical protein
LFHGDGSNLTNLPPASGTSAITGTTSQTFEIDNDAAAGLILSASGLTTSDKTFIFPNTSGIVVTTNADQTLTNKTLTSPNISALSNLTANGFVKTSDGTGALSVDTNSYSLSTHNHSGTYEPVITGGQATQYWRGDKSWQTLDKSAIGLSSVDDIQQMPLTYLSAYTSLGTSDILVPTQNAVKSYVDAKVAGLSWKEAVLDIITDNTAVPPAENNGDRYLLSKTGGTPHANWDGASAGDMVQFNGTSWVNETPQDGDAVFVEDVDTGYVYTGSAWTPFTGTAAYEWGSGLAADGVTINVGATAPIAVGVSNVSLNYDTSDFGVDGSNNLYVKEAGIDHNTLTNYSANQHIDWTNANSSISTSGNISTTGSGAVTAAGGASISGGLNNNTGGITNAGAISGAVTIVASSTITSLSSIGLAPEYDNAAPIADGSDNFGTLSLQYDTVYKHNYYEWTTGEPAVQDYDIVLRYRLPDGFISFDSVPIKLWNKVSDDTGNTAVTVSMRDTSGNAVTLSGGSGLQNESWTESEITISGTPAFQAGGCVTITIKLSADQGDRADIGELTLKGNW